MKPFPGIALLLMAYLTGCSSTHQALVHHRGAPQGMQVEHATVVAVRDIRVPLATVNYGQGSGRDLGQIAGGAYADMNGLPLGSGILISATASLIGSALGSAADSVERTQPGQEIDYRTDGESGLRRLQQPTGQRAIRSGERIRIERGSFTLRVLPATP